MEYCLDTGNLEMVKETIGKYPVNCFSMNPSIAVDYLKNIDRTFIENARMIREVIGEETPFFLEAMGDTAEEMVADAIKMKELVSGNTYVKIPASPEGITAISMLTEEGIKTSATAIYTFNQALLAAQAGADYVAVYVSRLDKLGASGIEVVRKIKQVFVEKGMESKVSAASLKTPESVEEAIMAGADNVAVTLDMLDQLAVHPLTQQTLDTFKEDWEGLFGEGVRIVHMEG
ncbi:TPA: transaldolase family protein [Enterococcus faecium]